MNEIENKNKLLNEYVINLLSKVHMEYLLIKRILYKEKKQFIKQKQYKYILFIKKFLKKMFNLNKLNINFKTNEEILKEFFIKQNFFNENNFKQINDILLKSGKIFQEMLKLKLYLSYSLLMYGIISRIYVIFDYLLKNNKKIKNSIIKNN
jgi:hypothetical protein